MIEWRTGCSGFYYKHWKGVFYPEALPQKQWLNFYCKQLNSLELNVTFYRFPTEQLLRGWFDKSPGNFKFSVKAPRVITHYKKFDNCTELLNDFYEVCEKNLKEKLGCLLFQLSPSIKYSEKRLEQIVSALHSGFKNVVEFRDSSWWNKDVYDALSARKIIFCSVSHPQLPEKMIANSSTLYIRLHGIPNMFISKYSKEQLNEIIISVKKENKVKEVYLYFNNTVTDAGIINVLEFNNLINK